KNGEDGYFSGDRSRAVWWVLNQMLRRGDDDAAIAQALLDQNNKISEHIYDQPSPQAYVQRQIVKARAKSNWTAKTMEKASPKKSNLGKAMLGMREAPELSDAFGYDEMLCCAVLKQPLLEPADPAFVTRPVTEKDVARVQEYLQWKGLRRI